METTRVFKLTRKVAINPFTFVFLIHLFKFHSPYVLCVSEANHMIKMTLFLLNKLWDHYRVIWHGVTNQLQYKSVQ